MGFVGKKSVWGYKNGSIPAKMLVQQKLTVLGSSRTMSICESGINCNPQFGQICINVSNAHPLIQLALALPWQELAALIMPDLKKTAAGKWWMGRKLKIRIHLGVYLLQQLFNKTDRQIEYDVRENAAYKIFCGWGIVEKWHGPDHTKIEKFRSKLTPETQKKLANVLTSCSVKLGFANPSENDIDSTVQEANMAYPADSCLLKKLGGMCNKVGNFLNETLPGILGPLVVNMKKISSTAREYFFLAKNATKEIKNEQLMSLLKVVQEEVNPVIHVCQTLTKEQMQRMPWNQKRTINQIRELAPQYLEDVYTFLTEGCMVLTKRLSFHLQEVLCITKGKLGKKYQFGRVFQLCRIKGNFLFVGDCTSTHMPDKTSLEPMLTEHEEIFGAVQINSIGTDKGYYSCANEKMLFKKGVEEIGIQRPVNIKKCRPKAMSKECEERLINRRSGIEPLIGHVKQGGQMGRSRMKSDKGIKASGYTAVLGFNLRQLIRHQKGKYEKKAA